MSSNTPRLALEQPGGSDGPVLLRNAIVTNAGILDSAVTYTEGALVARQAANTVPHGTQYFATDTNEFSWSNGTVWTPLHLSVPRVTSLPTVGPFGSGALVDGQECYLVADSTNGVIWHLRYNAASVSFYKWEFVGGGSLVSTVVGGEQTSSNTYTDLTTVGPQIVLPAAGGDFEIRVEAFITPNDFGTVGSFSDLGAMSFTIGGSTPSDNDSALFGGNFSTGISFYGSAARTTKRTGIASGATITAKYRVNGGHAANFQYRTLTLRPIRVG